MNYSVTRGFLKRSIRQRRNPMDADVSINRHRDFLAKNAKSLEIGQLISLVRLSERLAIHQSRSAWAQYHADVLSFLLERSPKRSVEANPQFKKEMATITCSKAVYFLPDRHERLSEAAQKRIGSIGIILEDFSSDYRSAKERLLHSAQENSEPVEQPV